MVEGRGEGRSHWWDVSCPVCGFVAGKVARETDCGCETTCRCKFCDCQLSVSRSAHHFARFPVAVQEQGIWVLGQEGPKTWPETSRLSAMNFTTKSILSSRHPFFPNQVRTRNKHGRSCFRRNFPLHKPTPSMNISCDRLFQHDTLSCFSLCHRKISNHCHPHCA